MTTIILIIAVLVGISTATKRLIRNHPMYSKADLFVVQPKKRVYFSCVGFALAGIMKSATYKIDSYRDLNNWIGISDIVGEMLSFGVSLPTFDRTPQSQLWIDNIDGEYNKALLWLSLCVIGYFLYIYGMFKQSKEILWTGIISQTICAVFSINAGVTSVAHCMAVLSNYNGYNGDVSDCTIIPFATLIMAGVGFWTAYYYRNRIDSIVTMSLVNKPNQPQSHRVSTQDTTKQQKHTHHSAPVTDACLNEKEVAPIAEKDMKQCPYCGEEILAVAQKCRFCGEWLDTNNASIPIEMIRCSVCGEKVEKTSDRCPICHEPLHASHLSLDIEETTKECLICGEEILEFAKKCKFCGEWQRKKKEYIDCSVCGEKVEKGLEKCPYCHEPLSGKPHVDLMICPNCGEFIPTTSKECPECNEPIED